MSWLEIDKLPPKMAWEFHNGLYIGTKLFNGVQNKLLVILWPDRVDIQIGFKDGPIWDKDVLWGFMPMGHCTLDESLLGREGKVGHYIRMVLLNQIRVMKALIQDT